MHASQRGSVLLTVIAGILILAIVGAAALSLMTSSGMTVVDGRETVQAAYLAESGKEIVRAQTASQSGGALMQAAVSLTDSQGENGGKGLAVDGTGFVRAALYPSWFRWHDGTWDTTSLGWYGGVPTGKRAWLAMSSVGAVRYEVQAGKIDLGTAAADVYFIGRVEGTPVYSASSRTLSVRAKEGDDDFRYFPKSGGLIGLVEQKKADEGDEGKAVTTSVSDIRFLYDTLEKQGDSYVFSNVTPFPQTVGPETITAALKGHDMALGQYFRVVCESVTAYGARSALVWHTNGRNSLRYAENGNSGEEGVAVGGNKAEDLLDIFGGSKDEGLVTGDNIMGNLQREGDKLTWNFNDKGEGNIHGANKDKIEVNHFLKRGDSGGNQEYWWVALASPWLAYEKGKSVPLESMMQYSFEPDDEDENYFSGILCRLAFVNASGGLGGEGTVRQGYGAKGIGVGVMQGEIVFQQHQNEDIVKAASVNPALLPGFRYDGHGSFVISPEDREALYGREGWRGTLGMVEAESNKTVTRLFPLLVVWAYDDTRNGDAAGGLETLKPLAIAVLRYAAHLDIPDYLSLTVRVKEEDGENNLTVWVEEKDDDLIKNASVPQWPTAGQKPTSGWVYTSKGVSQGTDGSLSTAFATGEAYRRVGIFSEVYPFGSQNNDYADIVLGNFFFTGTGSGGSLFPGGLTPGIVN